MKILIGDIELSHATYLAYPAKRPQYLRREQMLHPQFLFSFAYNWYGQKRIHCVHLLQDMKRFRKNFRDDEHVIREAHRVLSEADVFVGHNSDRFDIPHIEWRAKLLGLPPITIAKVDTLKAAKKHFNAPSNSMDNLLKDLGYEGKVGKPTEKEWFAAALGDIAEIRKIIKYNKHDVRAQIKLYEEVRPWITNHPNFNLFVRDRDGNEIGVCRNCGSPNLHIKENRTLTNGSMRHIYSCKDCGAHTRFNRAVRRAKYV